MYIYFNPKISVWCEHTGYTRKISQKKISLRDIFQIFLNLNNIIYPDFLGTDYE